MLPQAGFPGEAGAAVTKVAAAGMPIKARVSCFWHNLAGRMLGAARQRRMQGQVYRWYRQPKLRSRQQLRNFGAGGGGGGTGNVGLSGEVFVAEA